MSDNRPSLTQKDWDELPTLKIVRLDEKTALIPNAEKQKEPSEPDEDDIAEMEAAWDRVDSEGKAGYTE